MQLKYPCPSFSLPNFRPKTKFFTTLMVFGLLVYMVLKSISLALVSNGALLLLDFSSTLVKLANANNVLKPNDVNKIQFFIRFSF